MEHFKKTRLVYRDLIKNAIYDQIANGELLPGERILELDWAEKFNTSQAPVREALRDLESMGIVVSIPFKGTFVRKLTVKELLDIHKIRSSLEGIALKNAILNATDEEIKEVKRILDKMKAHAKKGEVAEFINEDISFHQKIVELADTTDLMKMWNLCNVRLWTKFNVNMSKADVVKFANSHDEIYEVLKNREKERAHNVMEQHFREIAKETL